MAPSFTSLVATLAEEDAHALSMTSAGSILEMLVDKDASVAECVAAGFAEAEVKQVQHLLYISEYKRFQSAPGTRLSKKAFWLDRRYPIVNRWRDRG